MVPNIKTKNTNSTGAVLEYIFRSYKDRHVKNGIATHDGCAVAYMIDPSIFKVEEAFMEVKYFDEIDSGILVYTANKDLKNKKPNVKVCTEVNVNKFKRLYFKLLKKCK